MRSCVGCGGARSRQGKTVKQITDNPEMQQQMKARLEELKESELSKKGKDAFETVKNDKQTKKVDRKRVCVMRS